MHEQSQSAKLRRALISATARLGGTFVIRRLTLSRAETAALSLRDAPKRTPTETPVTTFAIPLVGAHHVSNWDIIESTLARTLTALCQQSNPNWRAVVCSQTRPDAVDLDPRISYLPFHTEVTGHDKVAKLQTLAQHCLSETAQPGFYMPLDGDDLLHRDFVQDLHAQPDLGLLVCNGYIVNAETGSLGQTAQRSFSQPLQKPFWKFCGSCMALPTGAAPVQECEFFAAMAEHEHRLYPYLAELAGYRLQRGDRPYALYIINHGENFETRRGRGGFKQRFVERFKVQDQAALTRVKTDFPGSENLLSPRKADL